MIRDCERLDQVREAGRWRPALVLPAGGDFPVLDPRPLARLQQEHRHGEPDPLAEVVGSFVADAGRRLGERRRPAADADSPGVRAAAHALGGASLTIEAVRLAHACAEFECEGTAAARAAAVRIARLEAELDRLAAELRAVLQAEAQP